MERSALILAGGKGTRLGEREKALLVYKDKTLLENSIDVLGSVVEEVIVSVRDARQLKTFSKYAPCIKLLCDHYKEKGPLSGMLEGMQAASGNYVFVVACDMPFLQKSVVEFLFQEAAGHDAAVPMWKDGKKEPLHAVYNREQLIPLIERSIFEENFHVMAAVSQLHDVRFISMDKIQLMDRQLSSFANVNTPADLDLIIEKGVYNHE